MSVYVPAALKRLVRERFGSRRPYCRTVEDLTATHFEIEHIGPRSAGGETVIESVPFVSDAQPLQVGFLICG
jgi:hypothetical protein